MWVGNGVCAGFEKNWVGKWMRCSTDIQKKISKNGRETWGSIIYRSIDCVYEGCFLRSFVVGGV